jgi:hypothetical protein
MQSTRTTQLSLPNLPVAALTAHVFDDLASGSLLSAGQLCDHGCEVTFTSTNVRVTRDDQTVLQGQRSPHTGLWEVPIGKIAESPELEPTCCVNFVTPTTAVADHIAFLHSALFSLALSTLCAAIDAGRLTTFPGLTAAQVRRHPP